MKERHSQPKQITQETSKIKQKKKNQLQNKIYLPWLLITDKKIKKNTETFGSLYVCVL